MRWPSAELRPGADESRVAGRIGRQGRTQLAQAEQAIEVARATLLPSSWASIPRKSIRSPRKLLDQLPPDKPMPALDARAQSLALEQNAAIARQRKPV